MQRMTNIILNEARARARKHVKEIVVYVVFLVMLTIVSLAPNEDQGSCSIFASV